MKPKPDTRNVNTAATTQPTGDKKSAPSSLRAMAATLRRPVRHRIACTESAAPGPTASTGAALTVGRARGGAFGTTAVDARAAGMACRCWVICLRTLARARRLEDLLTFRRRW